MTERPTLVIGEQALVVAGIGDPGRVCAPDHKFQLVGITDAPLQIIKCTSICVGLNASGSISRFISSPPARSDDEPPWLQRKLQLY